MKFSSSFVVLLLSAVFFSCERTGGNLGPLSASVSSDMVCKTNDPLKTSDPVPESSCISYNFDGDSLLTMTHYNAGFNCCPEKFAIDVEVKGDSLIIREGELKQGCKCNCLFNLDIRVVNLPAGTYHVRFVEPYVRQPMLPLTFDLNLKTDPEGQICVTRPEGWWR